MSSLHRIYLSDERHNSLLKDTPLGIKSFNPNESPIPKSCHRKLWNSIGLLREQVYIMSQQIDDLQQSVQELSYKIPLEKKWEEMIWRNSSLTQPKR